jgi:pyruvate formate lyase activating enzyme
MLMKLFPLLNISRHRMGIDGRGVTTLVCGARCPLSCKWCINKHLLSEAVPQMVTADDLYEMVRGDDLYFRATGGGITFGGGEALLQADFFAAFRAKCKNDWRLCAETSLAVDRDIVDLASESIDEFIVDCKDMDPEIYHSYTGGYQKLMEQNLIYLLEKVGTERVVVRVPLIPDYNTHKDRERSISRLKELGVTRLDIFDYVRKE